MARQVNWNKDHIQAEILAFLIKRQPGSYSKNQLAKIVGVKTAQEFDMLHAILSKMEDQGLVVRARRSKYRLPSNEQETVGKVDITSRGYAYIICAELDEDVFVPAHALNSAQNDDIVRVRILRRRSKGRLEGEVVKVLERARDTYVGILERGTRTYKVVSDNPSLGVDVLVKEKHLNGAKPGNKVIVKIIEWPHGNVPLIGEILEDLGQPGLNDTEMQAIAVEYGFAQRFPDAVIKESELIERTISKADISSRRDFRGITTMTIDPVDAKDFDDALSVQWLDNRTVEIGIHIADVSHYVRAGSALDQEAYKRATSVYMADRVLPMLPEHLSNLVCSLRPDEEKLCYSIVFKFEDGKLVHDWIGKTVIKSDRRFAYDEAQEIIDTGKGEYAKEVLQLNQLAKKLAKERSQSGSINFSSTELKLVINRKGEVLGVKQKERKEAHMLVEDFMLLANKTVAKRIARIKNGRFAKSFVYRVHDDPDPEKIGQLADFARMFGYKFRISQGAQLKAELNKLIAAIAGTPEETIISQMAIRSMAKAVYTTENIGHFGLSFEHYSHFTSPIRRYPDLIVHRLLFQYLEDDKKDRSSTLEEKCLHCSAQERKAAQAERASVKYKQLEMLVAKEGDEFDGIITGIKDYGVYVRLDYNLCEGLVRFRSIHWDKFYFEEKEFSAVGVNSRLRIGLGQKVKVSIMKVNIANRQLDLAFPEQEIDE